MFEKLIAVQPLEASDDDQARERAQGCAWAEFGRHGRVNSLRLTTKGKRGVLGMGKTLNKYEAILDVDPKYVEEALKYRQGRAQPR